MTPRQWYRFENQAGDPSVVDIHIIDFIGDWVDDMFNRWIGENLFGVTARQFVEDLSRLPENVKTIRVHINSPGGDVQAGVNIANALRDQQVSKGRVVETHVDGLAASSASVIAMAGGKVVMADNALMMIHNAWVVTVGSAAELRKTADLLDTIRGQIVATYQWHTPLGEAEIIALLDAETWMTADEAIGRGFATDKIAGLQAAASINPKAVAALKVPEQHRARVNELVARVDPPPPAPVAASAADVLRICREQGCLDLAEECLTAGLPLEAVQAKAAAAKAARDAAQARATEIRALCTTAKLPELADGYIEGQLTPAAVRAHLAVLTAKLDQAEIDGGLLPNHGLAEAGASWQRAFARIKQLPGRMN